MLRRSLLLGILGLLWGQHLYGQAYNLVGDAVAYSGDCYLITADVPWQNGAVWYTDKLSIASSFEMEFTMYFGTHNSNGADGMVFVLQTQGNTALGNAGQGIGFKGFSPSLGVEFDTHRNVDEHDPVYDHIAVVRDGIINHQSPQNLAGPVQASAQRDNIEDGQDHLVRIKWIAPSQVLEVYFDCEKRLSTRVDMADIFGEQREVWWGFTGGTGQLSNTQRVCLRKDIVLRDTLQICQGEAVQLVARSSPTGRYSWSPAELVSAPVQSPVVRPDHDQLFVVSYEDYCGTLTHDSIFVQVSRPFSLELGPKRVFCGDDRWELIPEVTLADPTQVPDYRWSTGETLPAIIPPRSGWYQLTLQADHCQVTDSVEVIMYPEGYESTLPRAAHCLLDEPIPLSSALPAEDIQEYYWPHSQETGASVYVSREGEYILTTLNHYGCRFRETFVVDDNCPAPPQAPDAFTPNSDGHNDTFRMVGRRDMEIRWMVYDRWGNVIFVGHSLGDSWDGHYRQVLCLPGAYAWKANYRPFNKPQDPFLEKRGVVWLIR